MRILLFTLTAFAMSTEIYASSWVETCGYLQKSAKIVMKARQVGVPMEEMMKNARLDGIVETQRKVYEELIILAYDIPRYNSEVMQKQSISDFQSDTYLNCVKQLRNN